LAKLFTVWLTLLIIMLILILLVGYVIIQFMKSRDEDKEEYILVKYDKFLRAYVGYRITE
jgi:cytochrome c oxidase assembly factor CtaG